MRLSGWGSVFGVTRCLPVMAWFVSLLLVAGMARDVVGEDAVQQATAVQPLFDPARPEAPRDADASRSSQRRLLSVLNFAQQSLRYLDETVRDYTCLLVRRERVDGVLSGYQHLHLKLRHEQRMGAEVRVPFSVYLKFLAPERYEGREVLFVHGQNNGSLIARRGGSRLANLTLMLDPQGSLAMQGNRYPVTDVGIRNLMVKLIEVIENDASLEGCEVQSFKNARINQRPCMHVRVAYPQPHEGLRFQRADVYIDDQLKLPICFTTYDWPKDSGGEPVLLEEYVYSDLRLNVGLTDEDFNPRNPTYQFQLPDRAAAHLPIQPLAKE